MDLLWLEEKEAGIAAPAPPEAEEPPPPDADPLIEEAENLDVFVPPAEVLARIETLTRGLAEGLLSPEQTVPALELRGVAANVSKKRLLHPRESGSSVRLWRVLAAIHANLRAGRSCTQRELYYHLADGNTVSSAAEINASILDATRLLGTPRACLAITCASRGSVAGCLAIREQGALGWADLAGTQGCAIQGSLAWVDNLKLRSDARCVLVIEKDAVFNRLLQERACERLHAVALTARGMPDLATRALLQRLTAELPHAPVLGLFDWNASGALILCCYRGMQSRTARTVVEQQGAGIGADVRWLCARSGDLAERPDEQLLALTQRDEVLLRNLLARLTLAEGDWAASLARELTVMSQRSRKAELESLYTAAEDLTPLLTRKILHQDWI